MMNEQRQIITTFQLILLVILVLVPSSFALTTTLEGKVTVQGGSLWYRHHKLSTDGDVKPPPPTPRLPPIVVLHGGPGVPSDYLFPLSELISEREVIFYDQLGCGRSDCPTLDSGYYGVEQSVDNLRDVLRQLNVDQYHLYGQSWGGILAFSHVSTLTKKEEPDKILSLTMSNTPASVKLVNNEAKRLMYGPTDCDGDIELFMKRHNCRLDEKPKFLDDAYAHAGTIWRGTDVISDWCASTEACESVTTPTLVLRGQYDFVTKDCVKMWRNLPNAQHETLPNASHHALLEETASYMSLLRTFLSQNDP